jgi:predicted alpha/beta superfamily hydrolase
VPWAPYPRDDGHTVVGDLRVLRDVESPQLGNQRDVLVHLPPTHGSGRRFPVVYMHDGQNLFDAATSNDGEWRVDETMQQLEREGIEAIVVGIPHAGDDRRHECAEDGAHNYLAFLVDTVRPLVEEEFPVDARRETRGLVGSSLGGVISLHGLYAHPETFGFAGVMSPAFFWNGDDRWFDLVERSEPPQARIYIDVGDREVADEELTRRYVDGFERMTDLLRRRGFEDGSLRAVLDQGGVHHERDWARRLPDALRFLLATSR